MPQLVTEILSTEVREAIKKVERTAVDAAKAGETFNAALIEHEKAKKELIEKLSE